MSEERVQRRQRRGWKLLQQRKIASAEHGAISMVPIVRKLRDDCVVCDLRFVQCHKIMFPAVLCWLALLSAQMRMR